MKRKVVNEIRNGLPSSTGIPSICERRYSLNGSARIDTDRPM